MEVCGAPLKPNLAAARANGLASLRGPRQHFSSVALMPMRRLAGIGLVAVAASMACAQPAGEPPGQTLRGAAAGKFLIGAAIRSGQLDEPAATALILSQFSCLTGEYEFMPGFLHPLKGWYRFGPADRIAAFGAQHGLPVTGHMLCWHMMTPWWMFEDWRLRPLPRDEALENLRSHINAVVGHFRGRLSGWVVVNEAISDTPGEYLRDTPAFRAIGGDYVRKAFEFAHAADPGVPLYYNDYNVESPAKLPKVIRLVRSLKAAGVRLDAVGIQGHWLLDQPGACVIEAGIGALRREGVKVLVTELDVDVAPRKGSDPYRTGLPGEVQLREARRYGELFAVFMRHRDAIPSVTFWGLEDGQSWLNDGPLARRTNYPLLFDRALKPKPELLNAAIGAMSRS